MRPSPGKASEEPGLNLVRKIIFVVSTGISHVDSNIYFDMIKMVLYYSGLHLQNS